MQDLRAQRWLGVAGLVFVLLLVVAIVPTPMISSHASAAKVIHDVHQHKGAYNFAIVLTGLAIIEGLFFFGYLRDYLRTVEANTRLATIGYIGVVVFAVAGGISLGIFASMVDAVGHVSGTVMQMLNVLQNNLTFGLGATGTAVFLFSSGVAVIRNGPLPKWLGWVAIVLGILGVVVGVAAAGLWVLIASIVILVRARGAATAPAS